MIEMNTINTYNSFEVKLSDHGGKAMRYMEPVNVKALLDLGVAESELQKGVDEYQPILLDDGSLKISPVYRDSDGFPEPWKVSTEDTLLFNQFIGHLEDTGRGRENVEY
mgnify:CR=1 FL=1